MHTTVFWVAVIIMTFVSATAIDFLGGFVVALVLWFSFDTVLWNRAQRAEQDKKATILETIGEPRD